MNDTIVAGPEGACGAVHLPNMIAAKTHLPALGLPVPSRALNGLDSLLSIAQMLGGVPVGTLATGDAGPRNAALLAASTPALHDDGLRARLIARRDQQTAGASASTPAATMPTH